MLGVPPEDGLLAEEELVGQSEHEEAKTKYLDQNLKISSLNLKLTSTGVIS